MSLRGALATKQSPQRQVFTEIIAGRNPVREALAGRRRVHEVLLARGLKETAAVWDIRRQSEARGVSVRTVDRQELDAVAPGLVHQGVVARVAAFEYAALSDVIAAISPLRSATVVLLDGVTDPQNLGSLIRTAEASGVAAVVIPKRRTAPVTPAVVKASAGATEHLSVVQANIAEAIRELKKAGFWLVGAAAVGGRPDTELDLSGKTALALGSEGAGLSRLVASRCDFTATIPMQGKIRSLNVSVAGALLMYEAKRQREQK